MWFRCLVGFCCSSVRVSMFLFGLLFGFRLFFLVFVLAFSGFFFLFLVCCDVCIADLWVFVVVVFGFFFSSAFWCLGSG